MFLRTATPLFILGALLSALVAASTWSSINERCFVETGYCVSGRFRQYWEQHGGISIFGMPISEANIERDPVTGRPYLAQWFEHHRFEQSLEQSQPQEVTLSRIGEDRLWQLGINWRFFEPGDADAPHYMPETGQAIAEEFWDFWHSPSQQLDDSQLHTSLMLFGLPLSPAQTELDDGTSVLTQWFERARFEYRMDSTGSSRVVLAQLGREVLNNHAAEISMPRLLNPITDALPAVNLEPVGHGFEHPVFVTHAGDGSGRLFVAEKAGLIRQLGSEQPFLDLRDRVGADGAEQGLLGLAFHPHFATNGWFFVHYTDRNGDTTISRFQIASDGQHADPDSEQIEFFQHQPEETHNGGMLAFGPDGLLYVGLGDGGGRDDPLGNGQNLETAFGAILRINVDQDTLYSIPDDNPFATATGARSEIWAYGLRNPWRFSFDHSTGDLYIADVGQDRYEQIYMLTYNASSDNNFGWPIVEGGRCLKNNHCDRAEFAQPIAVYDHRYGCAVVGGYVYRGTQLPSLYGHYLFGDFCSGRIWALQRSYDNAMESIELLNSGLTISSFGEDETGELYVTDFNKGKVYRLTDSTRAGLLRIDFGN